MKKDLHKKKRLGKRTVKKTAEKTVHKKKNHVLKRMRKSLFLILLLVAAVIALVFYMVDSDSKKLDRSLDALRAGNLEKGLELCNNVRIYYYSDVCYINYIGMRINNREPFEKEICDKISSRRDAEKEMIGCG
jgi:short subunit fatty acids transporter